MGRHAVTPEDYLARIRVGEREPPTHAALCQLHEAHLLTVPFENLDIHQGVPIDLEVAKILAKIVGTRRGGFCYELNGAFAWLLEQLGYRVTLLAAEVWSDDGFGIPFDHLTLRVDLERPVLVDVGFGDCFRFPLALDRDEHSTQLGHEYRILERESSRVLERRAPGQAFVPQYRFSMQPRTLPEFAGGCDHHQTSAQSPFTRGPVCSLALPQGRVTVCPDRVIVASNGQRTEHEVHGDAEWREALRRHCGVVIEHPDDDDPLRGRALH